jgi:phosphate transport system permease protein
MQERAMTAHPLPAAEAVPAPTPGLLQRSRKYVWRLWAERSIVGLLFLAASVATLATAAIFLTMLLNGWTFFEHVPLGEFLFGTQWAPDHEPGRFGSVPLLKGTMQIALGAVVIGVPLGVGAALFLSEFASSRVRRVLKPTLEVLAGIPSIVFGLLAVFVFGPWISDTFDTGFFTALSASLALAIMVIPIIAAISEDALRAVPQDLREGALALGATRWEATTRVVLPAAKSGITAAVILGFSRAIGETMVVTLAAGLIPTMGWNYLEPSQTITAFIANRAGGDLPAGSVPYLAIFALGLLLFLITFVINLIATYALAAQRRKFA